MSPERRKVVRLEDSKESWKRKAVERAAEIRRLKERVSDLEESRDSWRTKAAEARKELDSKAEMEKVEAASFFSKVGGFFLGLLLLPFAFVALCLFGLWRGLRELCSHLAFLMVERELKRHILSRYQDGLAKSASTNSRVRKNNTEDGPLLLTLASTSESSESSASSVLSRPVSTKDAR